MATTQETREKANERIVEIINAAKLSGTSEKEALLGQLPELLFRQEGTKGLVEVFLPSLVEFQTDTSVAVRRMVVDWLDASLSRSPSRAIVSLVATTLLHILSDENVNVVKRGILTTTLLYRTTLQQLAESGDTSTEARDQWRLMTDLKESVLGKVESSNDGVRTHALKFLEVLILVQSSSMLDAAGRKRKLRKGEREPEGSAIDKIAKGHPFLDPVALRKESDAVFHDMQRKIDDKAMSATNIQTIVNAYLSIAQHRPAFMARVVQALVALQQRPPSHLTETQVTRVRYLLKRVIVTLLERPDMAGTHHRTALVHALTALVGRDQAEKLVPERKRAGRDEGSSSGKRARKEEPTPAAPPPTTPIQVSDASFAAQLAAIPPEVLAELVLMNMENVPQPPPDFVLDPSSPHAPLVHHLTGAVQALLPTPTPESAAAGRKRDPRVKDPRLKGPVSEVIRVEESVASGPSPLPSLGGKAPVLGSEERLFLLDRTFGRMVTTKAGDRSAEGRTFRFALLSRLSGLQDEHNQSYKALLTHVLEDCRGRRDLALQWLYQAYYTSLECEKLEESRYARLLLSLLRGMKAKLDPRDKLFTRLLVETPVVTDGALGIVKEYCEDGERVTLGLSTLRDLIIFRPPDRSRCLEIVLGYTHHESDTVRSPSIRLVANKLFAEPHLMQDIEDYALKLVESLRETPDVPMDEAERVPTADSPSKEEEKADPAEQEGNEKEAETEKETETEKEAETEKAPKEEVDEAMAQRRLFLFFALCTKKHSLLERMAPTYAMVPQVVRQVFHKEVPSLIRTIGIANPVLTRVIASFPCGAEALILQVLHILTENANPLPHLVEVCRQIFRRSGDPRFLIPVIPGLRKDETLSYLPKFVMLPPTSLKLAVNRILSSNPTPLSPSELLVELHLLDLPRAAIRHVMDATKLCTLNRAVYKQEVLAVVIQQLVEKTPLPILFMRTVIQALTAYSALRDFIIGILNRLIEKKVWTDKDIWEGFIMCCKISSPNSFPVLLRLPALQLEHFLRVCPDLKTPLADYAIQHAGTSRALFDVLGLKLASSSSAGGDTVQAPA